MTGQRFLDLIGISHLIPGSNSIEMVMHVGQERAGWRGLVGAGVACIRPAASITLVFARLSGGYGTTTGEEWILRGINPVVLAVILQGVWNLAPTAISALYLPGPNELVLLFGRAGIAALTRWLAKAGSRPNPSGTRRHRRHWFNKPGGASRSNHGLQWFAVVPDLSQDRRGAAWLRLRACRVPSQ